MNRREFFKLTAIAITIPSIPMTAVKKGVPKRYRGFNVQFDWIIKRSGWVRQLYISDGKYCGAVYFGSDNDTKNWKMVKPTLDKSITRYRRKHKWQA